MPGPGGFCSGGLIWGVSVTGGVYASGRVCCRGHGIPACTEADPPVDRHTGVKHNLHNFVADGKNCHLMGLNSCSYILRRTKG